MITSPRTSNISRIRSASFSRIEVAGQLDVVVRRGPGSGRAVRVIAERKVRKNIIVRVVDGVLTITTKGSYRTRKPFRVEVSTRGLRGLHVRDQADVDIRRGTANARFEAKVRDQADLTLADVFRELRISASDQASVHAEDAKVTDAKVHASDESDVTLRKPSGSLDKQVDDDAEIRVG